jgi:hypothetical protein
LLLSFVAIVSVVVVVVVFAVVVVVVVAVVVVVVVFAVVVVVVSGSDVNGFVSLIGMVVVNWMCVDRMTLWR